MTTTTQTQPEGTCWHFLNANKCHTTERGRNVKISEALTAAGEYEFYNQGGHASPKALDALGYARGPVACLITLSGHGDKTEIAQERTVLWMHDATRLLREFACNTATDALDAERIWEPDPRSVKAIEVARQYAKGEATDEEREKARTEAQRAQWLAESVSRDVANAAQSAYMATHPEAEVAARHSAIMASAYSSDVRNQQYEMLTNMLLAEYEKDKTK